MIELFCTKLFSPALCSMFGQIWPTGRKGVWGQFGHLRMLKFWKFCSDKNGGFKENLGSNTGIYGDWSIYWSPGSFYERLAFSGPVTLSKCNRSFFLKNRCFFFFLLNSSLFHQLERLCALQRSHNEMLHFCCRAPVFRVSGSSRDWNSF